MLCWVCGLHSMVVGILPYHGSCQGRQHYLWLPRTFSIASSHLSSRSRQGSSSRSRLSMMAREIFQLWNWLQHLSQRLPWIKSRLYHEARAHHQVHPEVCTMRAVLFWAGREALPHPSHYEFSSYPCPYPWTHCKESFRWFSPILLPAHSVVLVITADSI